MADFTYNISNGQNFLKLFLRMAEQRTQYKAAMKKGNSTKSIIKKKIKILYATIQTFIIAAAFACKAVIIRR
jgi:hypothetical protein